MHPFALALFVSSKKALDPNNVKPGYLALSIVIIMCIATAFLLRSFIKHSKKASQPWESDPGQTKGESSGS